MHVFSYQIWFQSQAYLMLAALEKHRLSHLAMGHKHRYGLDGVPLDWEQSYCKYYIYNIIILTLAMFQYIKISIPVKKVDVFIDSCLYNHAMNRCNDDV